MQLVCRPKNLKENTEKGLYGSEKNHKNWGNLDSQKYSQAKKVCVGDRRKIAALQQSTHGFVYAGWQALVLLDCLSAFLKIMLLKWLAK